MLKFTASNLWNCPIFTLEWSGNFNE